MMSRLKWILATGSLWLILGSAAAVSAAGCSNGDAIEVSLISIDIPGAKGVAIDFAVSGDGVVQGEGSFGKQNDTRVAISCEKRSGTRTANVGIYNEAVAGQFFSASPEADLTPDVGRWEAREFGVGLYGIEYTDSSLASMNKNDKVQNFRNIGDLVESIRAKRSVKLGKLSPVRFRDPKDLLGAMLRECWGG